MASTTGNQQGGSGGIGGSGGGGGGQFDVNKLFTPMNLTPQAQTQTPQPPSSQNPNTYAAPTPSASYPPPSGPYSFPPQTPPYYHHQQQQQPPPHHHMFPPQQPDHFSANLHHQRSLSFPTPPLQPVPSAPPPPPSQNPNPTHGARLMALLSTPPPNFDYSHHPPTPLPSSASAPSTHLPSASSSSDFSVVHTHTVPVSAPVQPLHSLHSGPLRMPSSKLPRGRHLLGDRLLYDVDAKMPGEEQPQLEVTPITKYVSDPELILGRQIAVNKNYIIYGLKMGNIRVLNINTALRALLRGHSQRVTDMAFFKEDVPLLASASIEGRVFVWRISEGPDEEEKPQISGKVELAIHITGDEGSVHPRVCWHCHKQEILVVAIGKSVIRIDTTKVRKGVEFSTEEPLVCPVDKLIDGVQLVGKHEGEVTDLSMCQWMTTRLVSASKDGTIKIWEDRKALPLLVLRPHDGQPVDAAKFLTAPHQPNHVMLITAGPLNREVKLWAMSGEEGWLQPSDDESWRCIQTLELKSSAEPQNEEAFFNQAVALSQGGLLLLANAKKNAIYAIHLEYGANPASTRMDYLAGFTVTMPILSFTGTSDILPHGEHLVQVYCVQTQAIQQYALEFSQCLPPPMDNMGLEKSQSTVSRDAVECLPSLEPSASKSFEVQYSAPESSNNISGPESTSEMMCPVSSVSDVASTEELASSNMDSNTASLLSASSITDSASVAPPPLPLSPRLSRKISDVRGEQAVTDYPVDRQMDISNTGSSDLPSPNDDIRTSQGNISDANQPVMFKHPTHLVKPSEFMVIPSADATRAAERVENDAKIQDVVVSNDTRNVEVEVKVVGEAGFSKRNEPACQVEPQIIERKEKSFYSQASDLGVDMTRECCALPSETSVVEEARNSILEALAQPSNSCEEEDEASNDVSEKVTDFTTSASVPQSPTTGAKGKKQKGKFSQASGSSSPLQTVSNSAELLQGGVTSSSLASMDHLLNTKFVAFQDQILKHMSMGFSVQSKEARKVEASLGRSFEKSLKASADALWAHIQEDNAKSDKLLRDRTQQIIGLMSNLVNKDLAAVLEKLVKKELAAASSNVARTISPVIEKTVSSTIADSFQRGVGDKAVSQLEKSITSKFEATVARQIQAQFQTSGRQALQDGLKSSFEASIIPAFEMTCKSMFEQIDATFQKGIAEHTQATQHQVESTHSQLALALRDALNSASSLTQTLSGEFADGQRKFLALAAAGANSKSGNSLVTQLSNGPLAGLHEKVDQPFDPTKELSRLISEHKYEEAFISALQRSDVFIVSWLCSQVDLQRILSSAALPLSQGVLLSLLQQLACDITKDTTRKLSWMTDVASCIVPHDPMIAVHVRPILEQVYQILNNQRSLPSTTPAEISSIRVIMHVINSMLMTCK